jgi:hypothetical protein
MVKEDRGEKNGECEIGSPGDDACFASVAPIEYYWDNEHDGHGQFIESRA